MDCKKCKFYKKDGLSFFCRKNCIELTNLSVCGFFKPKQKNSKTIKAITAYLQLCENLKISYCDDFSKEVEHFVKKNHGLRFRLWETVLDYKISFDFEVYNLLICFLSLTKEERQKYQFLFIQDVQSAFIYLELMYKKYMAN